MNDAPAFNPFTLVYDALWDLAMRSGDLRTRVREGNRISFGSPTNSNPTKPQIAAGDLPELVLVVRSMSANLHNTSSGSMCTREYAWQISGGDYRYSQTLAPLEWELFCAMAGWRKTLTELRWRDVAFCKKMTLNGGQTGLSDPQNNRNIIGWSAVWTLSVEMHFKQEHLDDEIKED